VRAGLGKGARRIMVFTNYRATAARLVEVLNKVEGVSAVRLVGQASRANDRGLTQKKQTMVLDDFRAGTFNVLVATQIGEEGLDIVECDQVVFYDTVPSAVRYIQRRGRTGRKGPGAAVILIAKGTRDEAYYWISQRREREMAMAIKKFVAARKEYAPDQSRIEIGRANCRSRRFKRTRRISYEGTCQTWRPRQIRNPTSGRFRSLRPGRGGTKGSRRLRVLNNRRPPVSASRETERRLSEAGDNCGGGIIDGIGTRPARSHDGRLR